MSDDRQPEAETPPAAPAAASQRSHWSAGRVVGLVFTSIVGLVGVVLVLAGIGVLAAYAIGRDDDGYFTTSREHLNSGAYAIATEELTDAIEWVPDTVPGDMRIRIEGDQPLFLGIGTDADVDRYLDGVSHDRLIDFVDGEAQLDAYPGGSPRSAPGRQSFWETSAQGAGEQTVTWDGDLGHTTVVAMNANAARGVDIEADVAVKIDWGVWAGVGLLVVGLLLGGGAVVVILLIGRRATA